MAVCWRLSCALLLLTGCKTDPPPRPQVDTHVVDWRDEVIYEVLTDRFENGDAANDVVDGVGVMPDDLARHQGGDWAGMRARLPYLERLGVTTLWISPIVKNVSRTETEDGYHGYWASDFTEINRRYGSLDELRALVDDAHERGMKVIIDVVMNHAGRVFSYDLDMDGVADPDEWEPPFSTTPIDVPLVWVGEMPRMWTPSDLLGSDPFAEPDLVVLDAESFHRQGATAWASEEETLFGDFPTGLRDLATERPDVQEALVETYAEWVRLTDVDGFRLDAAPHVPPSEWAILATDLRARLGTMGKHRFLLLGEVFSADPDELARYVGPGMLDTVFDFTFREHVINQVILAGGPPTYARPAFDPLTEALSAPAQPMGIELTPHQARVAFADNHDTQRVRNILDDPFAAEIAMTAVFTTDGIPLVYYGTEQGFAGGSHHDSRERLWDTGFDETHPTYQHIARLASLRGAHPALRYGSLVVRFLSPSGGVSTEDDASMFAWERVYEEDRTLSVFNAHAYKESQATIPTGFSPGTVVADEIWNLIEPVTVAPDGSIVVRLPPRSAVLLSPR